MLGKLNDNQIEEILKHEVVGRIGCHADDVTYVVPTSYAYDGHNVYAHAFGGMKIEIMRKNPHVCFQVDVMKHMSDWQSVIAWGEFEEINKPTERNKALQILIDRDLPILSSSTTHVYPDWPFAPEDLNQINGIVYRIVLKEKHGRFEDNQSSPFFAG